jgi:hypothetical protein
LRAQALLIGGVVYETVGMNAPLIIMLALLVAMMIFALRSRRLRDAVSAEEPPPTEPTTPS